MSQSNLKDNSYIMVGRIPAEEFGPILIKILKKNNPFENEDIELFFYKTDKEEIVISVPGVLSSTLFIDFYETILMSISREKADVTAWFYHDDNSIAGVRKRSVIMCQRASEECVKRHGGDRYLLVDSANVSYIQEKMSVSFIESHPDTFELYKPEEPHYHPNYEQWPNPVLEPLSLIKKGKYSYKTNERNKLVEWICFLLGIIAIFTAPLGIISYENTLLPWAFSLSTNLIVVAIMALVVFLIRMKRNSWMDFIMLKSNIHPLTIKYLANDIISLTCEYLICFFILFFILGCSCYAVFGLNKDLSHNEQTFYCTAKPMAVDNNGEIQIIQFEAPLSGRKYNYSASLKSSKRNITVTNPEQGHLQQITVAYHVGLFGLPYIEF